MYDIPLEFNKPWNWNMRNKCKNDTFILDKRMVLHLSGLCEGRGNISLNKKKLYHY